MKTKQKSELKEYESPIKKSLYSSPELRSVTLLNENLFCVVSAVTGDNEGLSEDETGNDYDE